MIKDMKIIEDSDMVYTKKVIKQTLLGDRDILEALNNKDLDIDSPDDFLYQNIFGFVRIPRTQDEARNFICFTVKDVELSARDFKKNNVVKRQQIQFHAICHLDNMKTQYGVDRHDLLGALIVDRFNWTNLFGLQFHLIENNEQAVDSDYYCRTLTFEATKTNSLYNAKKDNPYDKY